LARQQFLWIGVVIVPLMAALSPSGITDWDTLAYHLAVPKLWVEAGRIVPIPFIHHSHFPFAFDSLFLLNLSATGIEGQHGAKLWSVIGACYGLLAIAGFSRRRGGSPLWAAVAFAGAPVVLWETGTAYLDVIHGLFAGLAALYFFEGVLEQKRPYLLYGCVLLGSACATKFTGLQSVVAIGIVLVLMVNRPRALRLTAASLAAASVLFAAPWFVRNITLTGNPVYPFLYERLGGRGWDQWRADIYRDEQQTFGVGRTATGRDLTKFPHAALGLGYQPGRYINPQQTEGGGFPMGAVGVTGLVTALCLLVARRRDGLTASSLGFIALNLGMWFFLSQQSRYIITLLVPLAVLLGIWLPTLSYRASQALKAVAGAQLVYTFLLLWQLNSSQQILAVVGGVSRERYLRENVPFYPDSVALNGLPEESRIALYDEVFGFFLDRDYVWANPGHSTLIPHEASTSGAEYVDGLIAQQITHVYVNLRYGPPSDPIRAVLTGQDAQIELAKDPNLRWRQLIALGLRERRLVVVAGTRGTVTLRVEKAP
jgi:hypothetical protein